MLGRLLRSQYSLPILVGVPLGTWLSLYGDLTAARAVCAATGVFIGFWFRDDQRKSK